MEELDVAFNRPIPGTAMTHEVGARPWQNPSQFSRVEEAAEDYLQRMTSSEFSNQLIDVMRMGIPLTTLANTIQLAGVMEGKHNIDVGILLLPILVEGMMLIGDRAGVEYTTGIEEKGPDRTNSMVARALNAPSEQPLMSDEPVDEEPMPVPVEPEPQTGLMSRRMQ